MNPCSASLAVLDFLLENDSIDDQMVKYFHDVNASQFQELPPNTQARLMLRVLRDAPAQPTGVAEASLGALNMLKGLAETMSPNFPPGVNLEALKPSPGLFTEVKTELVLKSLREGYQGEHPTVLLDTFLPPPDQAELDPLELDRRNEILEGLKSTEEAQQLLAKYPAAELNRKLLDFVAVARAALGPNLLNLMEKDINEGRYDPYLPFRDPQLAAQHAAPGQAPGSSAPGQDAKAKGGRGAGPKRKRSKGPPTTDEENTAGILANMSQSTAALAAAGGQDPLNNALQVAGEAGKPENGQAEQADAANGTPAAQPQAGTPLSPGQAPAAKPQAPTRRRNGRWNEEETQFLIRMVREKGKGKWKRILEEGGGIFQNRSQVDLKDKWRNLERQGVVGPQDLPPQQMPQLAGQVQIGMPHHVQVGPDGQLVPHMLMTADGQPLTAEQAQQYAQAMAAQAAQYAQIAANQQHLPPEILQQQMQQVHHQMQLAPLQQHMAPQQMLLQHAVPPQGQLVEQQQQQQQHEQVPPSHVQQQPAGMDVGQQQGEGQVKPEEHQAVQEPAKQDQ